MLVISCIDSLVFAVCLHPATAQVAIFGGVANYIFSHSYFNKNVREPGVAY